MTTKVTFAYFNVACEIGRWCEWCSNISNTKSKALKKFALGQEKKKFNSVLFSDLVVLSYLVWNTNLGLSEFSIRAARGLGKLEISYTWCWVWLHRFGRWLLNEWINKIIKLLCGLGVDDLFGFRSLVF